MKNTRLMIDEADALNNQDFGWLYRLINGKLGERGLNKNDDQELRRLSVKIGRLDNAMISRRTYE